MKLTKNKKIITISLLSVFLFALFIPTKYSSAQSASNRLVISAGKISLKTGDSVYITATTYNLGNKPVSFDVTPSEGISIKSCTTGEVGLDYKASCQTNFQSSKDGTFEIIASITYNGTKKSNKISLTVIKNTATLNCKQPLVINKTNDACITPPSCENGKTLNDAKNECITSPETLKGNGSGASSDNQTGVDTDTTYVPLAPLPGVGATINTSPECTKDANGNVTCANPCPFGNYLNTIIKLIIGLAAVLAMAMIVTGGLQYMTSELVSGKEAGKETITHAVLGLLIALGSYLLLNTINPALLSACLNKLPEAKIVIDDSIAQTPINGKYCVNTVGTNGGYSVGANWGTIAGNPATLPAGVSTHNGECQKVGDRNCTGLRGLNLNTINSIKNKCGEGCEIIVTAGTECWLHGGTSQRTTHHPGSPTIDIRATSSANVFFSGNVNFPNDNKQYSKGGVACIAEKADATSLSTGIHWHCE